MWIWSHLLQKSLMKNFIFCAVTFLIAVRMKSVLLRLIHRCFLNQKQKTKIHSACNSWYEILFSFPQGPIIGLLLFKIFTCSFSMLSNINFTNYADHTTPYVIGDSAKQAFLTLRKLVSSKKCP